MYKLMASLALSTPAVKLCARYSDSMATLAELSLNIVKALFLFKSFTELDLTTIFLMLLFKERSDLEYRVSIES